MILQLSLSKTQFTLFEVAKQLQRSFSSKMYYAQLMSQVLSSTSSSGGRCESMFEKQLSSNQQFGGSCNTDKRSSAMLFNFWPGNSPSQIRLYAAMVRGKLQRHVRCIGEASTTDVDLFGATTI